MSRRFASWICPLHYTWLGLSGAICDHKARFSQPTVSGCGYPCLPLSRTFVEAEESEVIQISKWKCTLLFRILCLAAKHNRACVCQICKHVHVAAGTTSSFWAVHCRTKFMHKHSAKDWTMAAVYHFRQAAEFTQSVQFSAADHQPACNFTNQRNRKKCTLLLPILWLAVKQYCRKS